MFSSWLPVNTTKRIEIIHQKLIVRWRAKSESILWMVTHASEKCPSQWEKFLAVVDPKLSLVKFLLQEWSENEGKYSARLQHCQLFVTCAERCFELSSSDSRCIQKRVVQDLNCNHKEADTRLLLHTAHQANSGYSKVVIRSPDTDVSVLGIHFASQISAQVFLRTGVKNHSHFLPLSQYAAQLGQPVSAALPGLHALRDSTSAFVGHGKKKAFSLLSDKDIVAFLAELCVAWDVS